MAQDELTRMWKDGFCNMWTIPAFPLRKRKKEIFLRGDLGVHGSLY